VPAPAGLPEEVGVGVGVGVDFEPVSDPIVVDDDPL
jgi:hypothetical protein